MFLNLGGIGIMCSSVPYSLPHIGISTIYVKSPFMTAIDNIGQQK